MEAASMLRSACRSAALAAAIEAGCKARNPKKRRRPAVSLMGREARFLLVVALLVSAPLALPAVTLDAEPMRLDDSTPRWVSVQFEVSPGEHPERLDRRYGPRHRAWLEPGTDGTIRVRVDGDVLEQSLFRDRNPVPGSFSDYVWAFEPRTGDVLSASFSGRLIHALSWGLGTTDVEARVEALMTTTQPGGFRRPRSVWGRRLHGFCDERGSSECTLVSPRQLDRQTGYVNAPGFLHIDSRFLDFATFSALGEAQFSELDDSPQHTVRFGESVPEPVRGRLLPDEGKSTVSVQDVAAPPPIP
jgi:hypothetical protein